MPAVNKMAFAKRPVVGGAVAEADFVGPRTTLSFPREVAIGTVIGLVGGFAWKFGYHNPLKADREAYYAKIRSEKN